MSAMGRSAVLWAISISESIVSSTFPAKGHENFSIPYIIEYPTALVKPESLFFPCRREIPLFSHRKAGNKNLEAPAFLWYNDLT